MLRVDDVRFRHEGTEFHYELYVPKGSITALIGPSGGGKSTLLDLIAGFLDPTSGRIMIDGQDVTSVPPALRPVTSLFQDHNLFGHLDVFTNVALGIRPNARLSASERSMVNGSLARLGIGALSSRRPYELSGGERQRAALARCLVRKRPLLLLDEPFAALDEITRQRLDEQLRELWARPGRSADQPRYSARMAGGLAMISARGPTAMIVPPARTASRSAILAASSG